MIRTPSLARLQDAFPQSERAALEAFKRKSLAVTNWRISAQCADSAIEGYGIQTLHHPQRGLLAAYINTGDTYSTTLLLSLKGTRPQWQITTWGDWVEAYERRHGRAAAESLSAY